MASTYSSKGFSIALGLFVLLLAVYALLQSPLFELQTVTLVGAHRVTQEDILSAGGLEVGTNLFSINLRELGRAIEQNPLIERVQLHRKFPGSLVAIVEERLPMAYLSSGRQIWAVDAKGYPLFRNDRLALAVPVITVEPPVVPEIGVRIEHEHLGTALAFVSALSVKARANLSEVHAGPDGLTAYTRDRITISLGSEGDVAEQALVLEALLEKIEAGDLAVSRIDLSRPRAPVLHE